MPLLSQVASALTRASLTMALVACGAQSSSQPEPAPEPDVAPGGECAVERCGPAMGMPARQCEDGSVGGNTGRCLAQPGGGCGWEVRECPAGAAAPKGGDCVKTGCSGTVCAEPGSEIMTTCEFKPEYACYRDAKCERQPGGACGWTQTDTLKSCLANPPKE